MVLDPDLYGARVRGRQIVWERTRTAEQNVFHKQNAAAGPSHIPLPPSSNPQTLSQIIESLFPWSRLQKPNVTESMRMLEEDDLRRQNLGFELDDYGMDLSQYLDVFVD